ncbi:MAG: NADH-quinone oxidoreductase subunit C [Candidatus Abyssobacteria bacterium SURF_5]|uniref:NADH-quinone oxidoreductase subunit C n=1 Tax=Abyssobacteria bacterium (strain SURF_5) TaxID=2093360 RepID=A0A3A4NXY5_ABYX5|nr:MAG: NADH-quinone oxidoreductase subunit C [Candidatus Abyssubacteria bacterium SURF_5]
MAESITIRKLKERFGDRIKVVPSPFDGMDTVAVKRGDIADVCRFLRREEDLDYDLFRDLTCVDYINETPRFEVVYHLYSISHAHAVRLKARVPEEDPTIDTISGIWVGANWFEREAYDMYGVKFNGHPDLRRLLLYPEFVGHPLRKDYPIDKEQPLVQLREEMKGVR